MTDSAVATPAGLVLDLENYVPALLIFLSNKLSRGASAIYRREFGVGIVEWRVMSQLAIEPGSPASQVCAVLGLDKAPVSRSLSLMERRGLIEFASHAGDGRQKLATLTAAGRALHDRVLAVALKREAAFLACLSAEERRTLVALLNRLHSNLVRG